MVYKKQQTPEQIKAKEEKKEKLQLLVKKIAEMPPEEVEKMKERINIITCEGLPLSGRNSLLLDLQAAYENIKIVMIGGFKQWNKVNRTVKKGEKSKLEILIPCNASKNEEDNEAKKIFFKWLPVFDISQTEELTQA